MKNVDIKNLCPTILIVENNKDQQNSIKLSLETEGYQVETANNGKEGLVLLTKNPSISLILLNLIMPVMNGVAFLEAMGKNIIFASIPVVYITSYIKSDDKLKSKTIVKKTIDIPALVREVRDWCS